MLDELRAERVVGAVVVPLAEQLEVQLADRGHDVLFLERDVPWYAANRDLPEPPWGRTAIYGSLAELRDRWHDAVATADAVVLGSYVPELIGFQDDGSQPHTVNEPPGFGPCPDNGPVSLQVGGSFLTCEAFVADAGARVTAVGYVATPDAEPIVWS